MRLTEDRLRAALVPLRQAVAWRSVDPADINTHLPLQPDDIVLLPQGGPHEAKYQSSSRLWNGRLRKQRGESSHDRAFPAEAVLPSAETDNQLGSLPQGDLEVCNFMATPTHCAQSN